LFFTQSLGNRNLYESREGGHFVNKHLTQATLALSMLAVAGCQSFQPVSTRPVEVRPVGIEGDWVGADGVAVSSFQGGQMVSTATDTGNRLAEGTYLMRDAQTVDISFTSLIRQTQINATCALVTTSQMNCTSSTGAQFTLVRRVA
jgi:hypothetical protein